MTTKTRKARPASKAQRQTKLAALEAPALEAPALEAPALETPVALTPVVLTPAELETLTRPRSVVKPKFKREYLERAAALGLKDKMSRRGCGDWLQRELQAETEVDGEFDLERFIAILDANGVDHSQWNTTTKGWQGRFRMSGSIVLRGKVGKSGMFHTPEGTVNVTDLALTDANAAAFMAKWAK